MTRPSFGIAGTIRALTNVAAASVGVAVVVAIAAAQSVLKPDPPKRCSSCDEWNRRRPPFRVANNTYYVGTAGLSSVLVTSERGHVLVDGGLAQSAAVIDENIRALGFNTQDVRLILVSHEHYDHAGGVAALQRATGAIVAASPPAARALERGGPLRDDPQFAIGVEENAFPHVANLRRVADGEVLRIGDIAVTAHFTPGHSPGSTSWTWPSCDNAHCLNLVYADSLTAVSADGYRFTAHEGVADRFRRSIATVRALPCDVLLSPHPDASNVWARFERRENGNADAFIDPASCRAYADRAGLALETRLASEHAR